jgi:hypothetical protein
MVLMAPKGCLAQARDPFCGEHRGYRAAFGKKHRVKAPSTGTALQRRLTILTKYAKNVTRIGYKFRAAVCLPPNPGRLGAAKGRVWRARRLDYRAILV